MSEVPNIDKAIAVLLGAIKGISTPVDYASSPLADFVSRLPQGVGSPEVSQIESGAIDGSRGPEREM